MDAGNEKAVDAGLCPLCGGGNACGSVAGAPSGSCWCAGEKFPPDLFDRLSPETRNKACICRACLEAHRAR